MINEKLEGGEELLAVDEDQDWYYLKKTLHLYTASKAASKDAERTDQLPCKAAFCDLSKVMEIGGDS